MTSTTVTKQALFVRSTLNQRMSHPATLSTLTLRTRPNCCRSFWCSMRRAVELMRMRGTFWSRDDMLRIAEAIGAPLTVETQPMTLKEFYALRPEHRLLVRGQTVARHCGHRARVRIRLSRCHVVDGGNRRAERLEPVTGVKRLRPHSHLFREGIIAVILFMAPVFVVLYVITLNNGHWLAVFVLQVIVTLMVVLAAWGYFGVAIWVSPRRSPNADSSAGRPRSRASSSVRS